MDINTENLFERAFDTSSGVIYFPVRHHSAGCSLHLEKIIDEYKPDCVLIEGPADTDELIPFIIHEETVPPVCIYSSYDDKKGLIDENCEKYRAYYPFLEYSPEMVALKKGVSSGAEVHFIDIPFSEMLVNGERRELQTDFGKEEYDDERLYTKKITEESGCRNFSEFWESRFETAATCRTSAEFVKDVMSLGYYMRQLGKEDENEYHRNLQREKYMAENIAKYSSGHNKTLVIAGAFHIQGLLEPDKKLKSLKKCDKSARSVYLMPYSFLETDSRTGYGAGILFPAFYQKIWERAHKKTDSKTNIYEETVLDYIVKTARYTRTKQPVSIPDEINAFAMAKSLAALRDKPSAGVFELTDSVRSTFVKGDINTAAKFELDFLFKQLTGMSVGKIAAEQNAVPPVVEEFHSLCKKYRIKTNTIASQDMMLETVKKPAHFEKSCFLHRMEFLETGFCKKISGADYVSGRDINLIREQWRCRYSTETETRLTDLSVFGSSIYQICSTLIENNFTDSMGCAELGKLMIHIYVMGMDEILTEKNNLISAVIFNDSNFTGICSFIHSVKNLIIMHKLRKGSFPDILREYIRLAFSRAVDMLDSVKAVSDDRMDEVCRCIKMLYSVSTEYPELCSRDDLCRVIEKISDGRDCRSQVYGVMTAVLFKNGRYDSCEYSRVISAYLKTAGGNDAALFLCGIFMAARDILLTDEKLLFVIDDVINAMTEEDFTASLPDMRYAFTNFIPSETERISGMIAGHYNVSEDVLYGNIRYSSEEILRAAESDRRASACLRKWGLKYEQ